MIGITAAARLADLLNSLGIVGPNIRHGEWSPDSHMPEPYPGPGWCVCGRVLPCEAAEVGEALRATLDIERLAKAIKNRYGLKESEGEVAMFLRVPR